MSSRGASTLDQPAKFGAAWSLLALLLAIVIIIGAILSLTLSAGRSPDRTGKLLAVFPYTTSAASIFEAVTHAEGKVMAMTMVPGMVEVFGETDGFSGRLLRRGAKLVLPQPGRILAVGACSYLGLGAYDRKPGKIAAGPM